VLIEGPRDSTQHIPALLDKKLKAPVAIFTLFVDRRQQDVERAGAYFPMCDYSPELEAVRAAAEVGAAPSFIDLTWPEMFLAEHQADDSTDSQDAQPDKARVRSIQDDSALTRGRWLSVACEREGVHDFDDLWDCWFESPGRAQSSESFFRAVLAWCIACRSELAAGELLEDGTIQREQAMKAEIDAALARTGGPIVVVTGGLHTVALPSTAAARPPAVRLKSESDAGNWLIRYDFEQLDRLNGYCSGMPSPEFYQRRWKRTPVESLLVEVSRDLRRRGLGTSTADVIAATLHLRRLAAFRDRIEPSREDFLDAVRSCFMKGAEDADGVTVFAVTRKLLTGDRIGEVPAGTSRPPIVQDFDSTITDLKLKLNATRQRMELDIYRSAIHRAISRLFFSLKLLDVPFAEYEAGPDFVNASELQRLREVWVYKWSPQVEAALIQQSRYGSTIREATVTKMTELIDAATTGSQRAVQSAKLVVESCRCGLHEYAARLLPLAIDLALAEAEPLNVIAAAEQFSLLQQAAEPLEAHDLPRLAESLSSTWRRAAFLVPELASTSEETEDGAVDALKTWSLLSTQVVDPMAPALRAERLRDLAGAPLGNPAIIGAACGLLYDDGDISGEQLGTRIAGVLSASHTDVSIGARFLRGVLHCARSACAQEPAILSAVNDGMRALTPDQFTSALPHLRLAFAELPPRATDQVAKSIASIIGVAAISTTLDYRITSADLQQTIEIDRQVRACLERDGLEVMLGATAP
jgi:hypothetical protein